MNFAKFLRTPLLQKFRDHEAWLCNFIQRSYFSKILYSAVIVILRQGTFLQGTFSNTRIFHSLPQTIKNLSCSDFL